MKPSVLIFDSGVGGLSILSEVRQLLPHLSLHYLMDNEAFPYGLKTDEELIPRVLQVCITAVQELQPDLLIIACNTASTLTLPQLRQQLDIPVVGVVPAIKVAAALAAEQADNSAAGCHIGLLATPATINRAYTDDLIREFAGHCSVRRFGSKELVQWAEDWISEQRQPQGLFAHLDVWLKQPEALSHVVLGCTHFPLLKTQLQQLWPEVCWVDSGAAIARRVASLLPSAGEESPQGTLQCFWTDRSTRPDGAIHYLEALGELKCSSVLAVE
ncbi:glutamate racemase [Thalassolituus hydrocarboniclasticus]|uniref:Glutamate racemase n=1 Tax=Thalassolituus hydrocarboniclasticus TaxID=2742796 RepID=A0ABY6A9S7_9GAMM|nr:glutamate racemase [Thalassolituus hydrocarboniclasticus]UXD87767.1 glutamate racemase [Thalassolituus hydrocarboniclasticus]